MSLVSRYVARKYRLPPAKTHAVKHRRDLRVPMQDGVVLLADHYYPSPGGKLPTILMRSPYGRRNSQFRLYTRLLAERGFQVLVQSCRGTFGSGGEFFPFCNERVDGLATIAWLKEQTWYSGEYSMLGPSYLSFVQWAAAVSGSYLPKPESSASDPAESESGCSGSTIPLDSADPDLKALVPIVTGAEFRSLIYPGESFSLESMLSWSQGMVSQEEIFWISLFKKSRRARRLKKAYNHLPLRETDRLATGKTQGYYQEWLEHAAPGDDWWDSMDHRPAVARVKAPVHLIGGFYDVLLPQTLECYRILVDHGQSPYLTIGPWTHETTISQPETLNETLAWLEAHLQHNPAGLRKSPVRLYVMGRNEWKDFSTWPPEGYQPERWYLRENGWLGKSILVHSQPDRFSYNPANPTPSVGGSSLTSNSGTRNNRELEARQDVLTFTSKPLDQDLEVIGPLRVELFVRSSQPYADFFARLCDVFPTGESINLSDGIIRCEPERFPTTPEGVTRVEIELWPVANLFKAGHRLRLQISGGAHPRFARNPGSGEPLATARNLLRNDLEIFHDADHPSAILMSARWGNQPEFHPGMKLTP